MEKKSIEKLDNTTYKIAFSKYSDVFIGGKDKKDFHSEVLLRKWGDETEIKISVPTPDKISIEKDAQNQINKLKFEGTDVETHIYPLEPREFIEKDDKGIEHSVKQLEEGGLEIEIILKKKPKSNIITLPIQTKGLKFYYQPELTRREIDDGAFRPENVVGSYAVYHATEKPFHISKEKAEKYKVGKAYHIYRPKIIDSNGWEVWGELNITNEKLTVTISQDFIDNAIYPIRHATGAIFGDETAGNSSYDTYDTIHASYFTGAAGIATSVSVCISDFEGDQAYFINGLYKKSDNSKVGQTAEGQANGESKVYVTLNFGAPPVIEAIDYWIACLGGDSSTNKLTKWYDSNSETGCRQSVSWEQGWDLPGPLSPTLEDRIFSIYCTYTPEVSSSSSSSSGVSFSSSSSSSFSSSSFSSSSSSFSSSSSCSSSFSSSSSCSSSFSSSSSCSSSFSSSSSSSSCSSSFSSSSSCSSSFSSSSSCSSCSSSFSSSSSCSSSFSSSSSSGFSFSSSSFSSSCSEDPTKDYSKGDYAILPADDTILETFFSCTEYPKVALDDDIYVEQTANGEYAIFEWKNQNNNDTDVIIVSWKGKSSRATSTSVAYLQIYNQTSDVWEELDSDNATAADTEFTLSGTQSTNLSDYYDASNWVACRVYQEAK